MVLERFSSLDDVEHGEHNGIDFVEISKIFARQDTLFFGTV